MSILSIYILDIFIGMLVEGVMVSLSWEGEMLVNLVINVQGCIVIFSVVLLLVGCYCLIVEIGVWFVCVGCESVFIWVQIDFVIGEVVEDYFYLLFFIVLGGWFIYCGS